MNEIKIFENPKFGTIRTNIIDGEPWFVASDVCRALEIDRSQTRRLDDDEKGVYLIQTPGGEQEANFVNESGLYNLVLGSRKPEAKEFKRWITHEVIPTIRKHGAYMTPDTIERVLTDPDTIIKLATQLKLEQEQRKALEEKVETDKPMVLFANSVSASEHSILVGELAKLIKQNGVDIGQNRLFERLRKDGYLIKSGSSKNMPTQRSMELGLFEIKESSVVMPNGSIRINKTPKVTGKGQIYFINLFLGDRS